MKNYYKNIKLNYLFVLVKDFNFTQGIWMLFLASKGLTLFEIGSLEAIFHITSFLMETPTGAIADLFGRKISRLVGLIFAVLSSVLLILSTGYLGYAISFIASALSYNFESGAGEALVYDSLILESKENRFMKITGNIEVIYQTTAIFALLIGGFIGNIAYTYVYYAAIAVSVFAFVIGLFFSEPKVIGEDKPKEKLTFLRALKKQYVDSFHAIKQSSRLIYLIIFSTVLGAAMLLAFYYCQLSLKGIGFTPFKIGIYLAIATVFAALGAVLAERIDKKLGEAKIIKYMPPVIALTLFGCFFTKYSIIPLSIMSFVDAVIFVATRDYINKMISSDKRATILSFESMLFSFCMILLFPTFGLLADYITIEYSFLVFGAIILIMALINLNINIIQRKCNY